MFNRTRATIYAAACVASHAKEEFAYRKGQRTRRNEAKAYNAMIAESQAKIGQYKPATIPVQVWA